MIKKTIFLLILIMSINMPTSSYSSELPKATIAREITINGVHQIPYQTWRTYVSRNSIPDHLFVTQKIGRLKYTGYVYKSEEVKDGLKYRIRYEGLLYLAGLS